MKRKIASVCLCILLLMLLSSCGESTKIYEYVDELTLQFLNGVINRNTEEVNNLVFPGSVEEDKLGEVIENILQYCPLDEGYEKNTLQWDVTTKLGSNYKHVQIEYELVVSQKNYRLYAVYDENTEGCGFTTFHIIESQ